MRRANHKRAWCAAILSLLMVACSICGGAAPPGGAPRAIPRNAIVVEVTANTALTPWLTVAIESFNAGRMKTAAGKPIHILLESVEAGQAVSDMAAGGALPALWIPDDLLWVNLLAEQGVQNFQADCVSVAHSPLVIAMWRPVAESLGWPGRSLGWLDVGSLAADPSAWAYYSGGQFGESLRLGHTHPGLSGSGVSALLAVVQAATSKAEAVSADDVRRPIVQASVGAFEANVSWFSTSTDDLGRTMRERGVGYLGAAVMYESTAAHYGAGDPAITPIYPFEGTFVAVHPACLNDAADAATQEAARIFRDYLLGVEAQQQALANGLRPVNSSVAPGAPLDKARGFDLSQPEIVFSSPSVETVYAVQELWRSARKPVNLVMLFDISGSMEGKKIENARAAAAQFVEQMGDDDFFTLIAFSERPTVLISRRRVGPAREEIIKEIRDLRAETKTALYDAIGAGAAAIAEARSPQMTNAMIVLSDGLDTGSREYKFGPELIRLAAANDTTVCAIAYGSDADVALLTRLAREANGNFYLGDEANIAEIYEEMSAAFGGGAGIGR